MYLDDRFYTSLNSTHVYPGKLTYSTGTTGTQAIPILTGEAVKSIVCVSMHLHFTGFIEDLLDTNSHVTFYLRLDTACNMYYQRSFLHMLGTLLLHTSSFYVCLHLIQDQSHKKNYELTLSINALFAL